MSDEQTTNENPHTNGVSLRTTVEGGSPRQGTRPWEPDPEDLWRLLSGTHRNPHAVLGRHEVAGQMGVRALLPQADDAEVLLPDGRRFPLHRVHPDGVYSALLPVPPGPYQLVVSAGDRIDIVEDGYRYPPTVAETDLARFESGTHHRVWELLGARRTTAGNGPDRLAGVAFTVWAPQAQGVRVRGDFNAWNGRSHPLRVLGDSGVWEVFVPGVEERSRYRFDILGPDGRWREKADPMARSSNLPPAVASAVFTSEYRWNDREWLEKRRRTDWARAPVSVYEVHLGSWRPGLGYRELAEQLAAYAGEIGFTHVQLLPVTEHPYGGSWGYQVSSYFAPTARFGDPDEFRYLVDRLHQAGIGVFCDFVPAHFSTDDWALGRFDGAPLYEHPDPRRGEHPDWGTFVFDYGRPQVRDFLISAARYWLEEFHIDGLRVDAVSSMLYLDYSRADGEWLPNDLGGRENLEAVEFLRLLNELVHEQHPGVLVIAEESTAWPGVTDADGLGFDLKWNLGWMHDTLEYLSLDPVLRAERQQQLTFSLSYAWSERFLLPLSHDEVVHGKGSLWSRMPGEPDRKAAGVRALLAYMWAHPGKQLLFMGGEFGQPPEWDADGALSWGLICCDPAGDGRPCLHQGIQRLVARLNRLCREVPALHVLDHSPDGFDWSAGDDAQGNVIAFSRRAPRAAPVLCVCNFSGVLHTDYRVGVPVPGRWACVLDTDSAAFAGLRAGPDDWTVDAEPVAWHGKDHSVSLNLAASSVVWLMPVAEAADEKGR